MNSNKEIKIHNQERKPINICRRPPNLCCWLPSRRSRKDPQQRTKKGEIASRWYKDNLLQGNHDKYRVMTVCSKNQDSSINVLIDGCNIQSLTDLKLLRVTIDNKITFSIRIRNVCKKISMKIGALLRYFEKSYPNGHQASAVQSSNTPPLHVLSYCMALLYRASDSRKLERLQERALHAVFL